MSIEEENRCLKNTLKQLIESANHNQQTQERFYALELYFLESRSYQTLIERILVDLKCKLKLAQVELFLIDRDGETQLLISEIYGKLDYDNLFYIENVQPLKLIYNDSIALTLSQKQSLINSLFEKKASISQSVALIPLYRGQQIIGSLHLGSSDHSRFHPDLASNFLQHLGSIISVCIENSLNQERYKHLSLVDLLTRAKNRRYFFQALAKEIARSSRSQSPISCLFLDIDHFKRINDSRGHLVGDRALREIAKHIQPLLRQSDILARFGGEEFTVLLPNTALEQALEIAERIRKKVADIEILDDSGKIFRVTTSIGASSWKPDKQMPSNPASIQNYLINQADKAVYQAKQTGRNQVCSISG
ncbi:DUF484 family protein [Aliikangiella coralliicola]|uniref:DUF484 family protein n=1 Tax=Aliikangiella coralliicola TaxID=2592383 RepID=UPI00143CDE0E|nr:DUF484 family protein [Aliikangiella coralliicola]